MKQPLDTKRLQEYCEAVVRHCKGYNEGITAKGRDEEYARLTYESLPQLETFLQDCNPNAS